MSELTNNFPTENENIFDETQPDPVYVRPLDKKMGTALARRTIFRLINGVSETWRDVGERVATGNTSLVPQAWVDYEPMRNFICAGSLLMSGRHLQHGDENQKHRNMEVYTNCSTAACSYLSFYLLLNGSGVGRDYSDAMMIVDWDLAPELVLFCDASHPDFDAKVFEDRALLDTPVMRRGIETGSVVVFEVPDSREGWAQAQELYERLAFEGKHQDVVLALDFSKVRGAGSPIAGMQNRPASGPVPTALAFKQIAEIKGKGYDRWKQAMFVDHYLAECVVVGGARRSARMATKHWKDPGAIDFAEIKKNHGLWSSNNSIIADAEFYKELEIEGSWASKLFDAMTRAAYFDGTGEPGIINVHNFAPDPIDWSIYEDGRFADSFKYRVGDETLGYMKALVQAAKAMPYQHITNPCGEIQLNLLGGYCVEGETRILHRHGYDKIRDLVGKEIEVFNGEKWSKTTPFKTGDDQKLLRVKFSDGSYLDCTEYHKFSVKRSRQAKNFFEVQAKDLWAGAILPAFRTLNDLGGESLADAYTYGAFLGDGSIELRSDSDKNRYVIPLYRGKHHLPVSGSRGSEQANGGIDVTVSHLDIDKLEDLKQAVLPDWVFQLDRESTLDFIKGWLDTDGCHHQATGGVSIDTECAGRAYGLQLLLRRAGFSFVSVNQTSEAGDLTNFGPRTLGLYRVYIPASEAGMLNAHRVATDYPVDLDKLVKQQRVVSVEELPGRHETFCFTEPERHMGVFNNVLTHQCVIADVVPFHTKDADEAEQVFRLATRALIRVNTMRSLYDREVKRTNRIGVGFTGLHEYAWYFFGLGFRDMLDEHGKAKHFWKTMARFSRAVKDEATRYSAELGVARPVTDTTVKPAGSTSKLFALTEGAHLASMREYLRNMQFRSDDMLVEHYRLLGYPVRDLQTYKGSSIVGFPTQPTICKLGMGDALVTAAEATPEEQYRYLMLLEKYWIRGVDTEGNPLPDTGNQVSYTLKYDPKVVSYEQFVEMIVKYQSQVRCCSVMPFGDTSAYEYLPEQPIKTIEEFVAIVEAITDPEAREDIDMEHLQCSSGSCPI